jgi:hypothetical protein
MAPVHVGCFADDHADLAEEVELASLSHSYRLVRRTSRWCWPESGHQEARADQPDGLSR